MGQLEISEAIVAVAAAFTAVWLWRSSRRAQAALGDAHASRER
jgi:hypothetical protein